VNANRCDWVWMAEALDDERLGDHERAAFARHVAGCDVCRRAAEDGARLRVAMLGISEPPISDFEHRRLRRRLLARVALRPQSSVPGRTLRRAAVCLALGVVILVVGLHALPPRARPATVARPLSPPRYEVTALADARWTNEEKGATARVTLSRGSAAFHVHHLSEGQRFLVLLPDGEVEVRGTRFVVALEHDRIDYVVVMEGKVALRRAGAPERLLNAGERWDSPEARERGAEGSGLRVPGASSEGASVFPDAARPAAPARRAHRASHHRRGSPHATAEAAPVEGPDAPDGDSGPAASRPATPGAVDRTGETPDLFARGVHAFRAGRFDDADGLWQRFLDEHRDDPRAEDAAFLRAVGRARRGDAKGAASLARVYLERFPHGMRRREAETLAGAAH
jgi:FecR protein